MSKPTASVEQFGEKLPGATYRAIPIERVTDWAAGGGDRTVVSDLIGDAAVTIERFDIPGLQCQLLFFDTADKLGSIFGE